MKRILTLAVTVVIATLAVTSGKAKAEPINSLQPTVDSNTFSNLLKVNPLFGIQQDIKVTTDTNKPSVIEEKKPEPPKPIVYVVVEGDNLSKIADEQKTTWQRLWQKNTGLANPDLIHIGDNIVVPFPDEQLADRPLPVSAPVNARVCNTCSTASVSSAGNGYDYGYCTWYVKNRRPDLPNNLGNANTWYYMAQRDGLSTGATPRAGAVGTTTRGSLGHVVYVESVNGDGTINVSEMNYQGWGVVSSRIASASDFVYIY